jgi:hypothetical protein
MKNGTQNGRTQDELSIGFSFHIRGRSYQIEKKRRNAMGENIQASDQQSEEPKAFKRSFGLQFSHLKKSQIRLKSFSPQPSIPSLFFSQLPPTSSSTSNFISCPFFSSIP